MKLYAVLLSAFIFCHIACGTVEEHPTCNVSVANPIDLSITGTWEFPSVLEALTSIPSPTTIVTITVDDYHHGTILLAGLCPTPVTVPITGCDNYIAWKTDIKCNLPDYCENSRINYFEGYITSEYSGELKMNLKAAYEEGCGSSLHRVMDQTFTSYR